MSERSADFFGSLAESDQRQTTINWPGMVQRVIDDYRQSTVLSHGVQKDAIQNSWDARTNRRHGTGWSCTFELYTASSGERYLSITDTGTHGLTGRVLSGDEYFADLPPDERWARFESLAFTHPEGAAEGQLGARGQGKFIFVGASARRRILYDTLRNDGVYRLGVRTVELTKSPVYFYEGDQAHELLTDYSSSLTQLAEVGTRVIIDEPVEELVSAILSGSFARAVGETWWPIITKFNAQIRVAVRSEGLPAETTTVTAPPELELPVEDNTRFDVWHREGGRLETQGERFAVKRLHIVHDKRGRVPADLRGVALIRGGMKVMSLPMRHVPAELADSVYGYVEFDAALDEAMKALESPTHYSFDLGRGVGRKLRNYIDDQLTAFAREKLGQGADPRAVDAERHREAERRALAAINRAARELGIVGLRGPGGGRNPRQGDSPLQPVAAVLIPPGFADEKRRINYGDMFEAGGYVRNRTAFEADVRLSVAITHGDETVWRLGEERSLVAAHAQSKPVDSIRHEFVDSEHEPGEYVLRAKAVLMDDVAELRKGHEHKATFRFWLEQDPPEIGVFETVDGLNYGDRPIDAEVVASENGGWKFQYNTNHPAKRREDDSEERLFDYLLRLMARELVYVDLRSDQPTQFSPETLQTPDETYRKAATVISTILFQYYA